MYAESVFRTTGNRDKACVEKKDVLLCEVTLAATTNNCD
jgi:hypothetical protein